MIGKQAFQFTAETFTDNCYKTMTLAELSGSYTILIFYPFDFTFVCPTEIISFSSNKEKFTNLGASVIFISCDSVYSHKKWTETEVKDGGIKGTCWPMVSDVNREVCRGYNMLNDNHVAKRGTVIIGKDGSVKYVNVIDDRVGRSVDEIIRVVENIKHLDDKPEVKFCAANFRVSK
ncbi:hypothetical protein COBT_002133 [Conglomerata obtusa]